MKITDKLKRKETTFIYVEASVVFKYNDCYFMATEEIVDAYEESYNCVNLETGELAYLYNDVMVEVLEAEMIVK